MFVTIAVVCASLCLSCAAAVVVAVLGFARHKGVNLSVLGIGVDFLQVCVYPCAALDGFCAK